ncbi:MAG: helix-turn-helix domain-containing protein [Saprospiraceae bacterium]|nr:helix-turn-helix domain-containing protein [Saprospiraceae bacterium]
MHNFYIPQSDLLSDNVISINTLKEFKDNLTYYAFPPKGDTIGFFEESDILINDNEIIISKNKKSTPKTIFIGKHARLLKIRYKTHVKKISVHFKEFTINHFFKNYFELFGNNEKIKVIESKKLGIDSSALFNPTNQEDFSYLENYLKNNFKITPAVKVRRIISLIEDHPTISISEISNTVYLTERTINRHFHKYMGCSVADYKRIVRFNKIVSDKLSNTGKKLKDLSIEEEFYDYSHLHKFIKNITNSCPRKFFSQIQNLGMGDRIYIKP